MPVEARQLKTPTTFLLPLRLEAAMTAVLALLLLHVVELTMQVLKTPTTFLLPLRLEAVMTAVPMHLAEASETTLVAALPKPVFVWIAPDDEEVSLNRLPAVDPLLEVLMLAGLERFFFTYFSCGLFPWTFLTLRVTSSLL